VAWEEAPELGWLVNVRHGKVDQKRKKCLFLRDVQDGGLDDGQKGSRLFFFFFRIE
jgi:hypothetical protein